MSHGGREYDCDRGGMLVSQGRHFCCLQLHAAAQSYTAKVKGKEGVESKSSATQHDEGDLYFVNPEGEFIASYGPLANSKEMGKDFSDVMKV